MKLLNIMVVAMVAYVLISLFSSKKSKKNVNKVNSFNPLMKSKKSLGDFESLDFESLNNQFENDMISVIPSCMSSNSSFSNSKTNNRINSNFINIQFHTDYRDVITGLNNLVPERKQIFNLPNIPLKYSEPHPKSVIPIVKDFLYVLNDNISTQVPDFRQKNSGWDEVLQDKREESGWEKAQKALGLPTSLYGDPTPKSKIVLVAIEQVQKYETDDEIKYAVRMVIQKINTKDQMRILVSFVQDKRPGNDENNFFKDFKMTNRLILEDLFVLGYYSNEGENQGKEFDGDDTKFFEYDKLEANQLVDPKDIQKELTRKYKIRNKEMNELVNTFDEEGQAFHASLPKVYEYSNIRATRTIYDDFNKPKVFT